VVDGRKQGEGVACSSGELVFLQASETYGRITINAHKV